MKALVQDDGILIPKRLLKGVKEVEIRKEQGCIIVLPIPTAGDPVFNLGNNPVKCGAPDAAECHDAYLYGQK